MSLLQTVSGLVVRYLPRSQVLRLRGAYLDSKRRLRPLLRTVYGSFTTDELRAHLEQRLDQDFEVLMVHSSVNGMQPMYDGNPLELVRMLMDFCGPQRTLAMPAFYFGDPKIGGPVATFQQKPRFDLRRTPSQMGLATEMFRRSKDVICSRHPVYRISALGPLAQTLTQGHEHAATPTGPGTPFDSMARRDTLILGIGKPFEVLTQVHHPENVMGDDFPVPRDPGAESLPMTLVDGPEEIRFELTRGAGFQWRRNMWKLRKIMDRESLREWTFHHVPMFATRAGAVSESITRAAAQGLTIYERR